MPDDLFVRLTKALTDHFQATHDDAKTVGQTLREDFAATSVALARRHSQDHHTVLDRIAVVTNAVHSLRELTSTHMDAVDHSANPKSTTALTTVMLQHQSLLNRTLAQAAATDKTVQQLVALVSDLNAQQIMTRACIAHFDMSITHLDDRIRSIATTVADHFDCLPAEQDDADTTLNTTPQRVPPSSENGPDQATTPA